MTKGRKEERNEEYEKQAMRTEARREARRCEIIMTDVDKATQKERLAIQKWLQPKVDDLMNRKGVVLEVIEAMRRYNTEGYNE